MQEILENFAGTSHGNEYTWEFKPGKYAQSSNKGKK